MEIDVTKNRRQFIMFKDVNDKTIKREVRYDWWPPFRKKCQMLGHNSGTRTQHQQQRAKPRVVQNWVPKQPQHNNVDIPEQPAPKLIHQPQQTQQHVQPASTVDRDKSNPSSVINTPI